MLTEVAEGKLKLSNKIYFLGKPRNSGIADENRKIKAAFVHIAKGISQQNGVEGVFILLFWSASLLLHVLSLVVIQPFIKMGFVCFIN